MPGLGTAFKTIESAKCESELYEARKQISNTRSFFWSLGVVAALAAVILSVIPVYKYANWLLELLGAVAYVCGLTGLAWLGFCGHYFKQEKENKLTS